MKKNLPHFKSGWEMVPESTGAAANGTGETAEVEKKVQKKKYKKWKTISLVGYVPPVTTFEDHPFTRKLMAEVDEKTIKEREDDVVKREKEVTKREEMARISEAVCHRFKCFELGRGRGAAREWRRMCSEEMRSPGPRK